jgi:hypothetical protein
MPTVTLQDQQFEVERWRGLKGILAIAALTRLVEEVPDAMAEAIRAFQERNVLEITPELAKARGMPFTEEDFQKAGGVIKVPAGMSNNDQVMVSATKLLTRARKPMVSLLSILITPNADLKTADKEGDQAVADLLDSRYDFLLDCDLSELADLAATGYEVVQEQLEDPQGRLGKMVQGIFSLIFRRPMTPTQPSMLPETATIAGNSQPTPPTLPPSQPITSTSSQSPTDGNQNSPSTESAGVASGVSPS